MDWKKTALFLKDGLAGVIPTDTIYGLCASALDKKAVEKVYELRKRESRKFNIDLSTWQNKILEQIWPGKVSVVLHCSDKKFAYLHRGVKTLAFRLPKKRELLKILSISGPLIAPSANPEGKKPAENISQAKKYFGKNIFYYGVGKISGQPSILIKLQNNKIKIIRKNSMIKSVLKL